MTRIKVCGITEKQHALVAAGAGADFIGLVMAPGPRQISTEKALLLSQAIHNSGAATEVVGVFVNAAVDEVNRIADYCRLDRVQLSGDETWEYCQQIERPAIKAIHMPTTQTLSPFKTPAYPLSLTRREGDRGLPHLSQKKIGDSVGAIQELPDYKVAIDQIAMGYQLIPHQKLICLLDTKVKGIYGGTGQTFDWQLAKEVAARFPIIIAGGLSPENVGKLVKEVQPWGVDVSTGVENNGRKDESKILKFIEEVRKCS